MIGRFEAEHQDMGGAVVDPGDPRFGGVDQPAVGRVEAGLRDRATARTASAAVAKSSKPTEADARKVGRSCRRIQASTMMPSAPSEPIINRSGLGPAPEPGSRRVSWIPVGVTTRSDSTKSSMWV